MSPRSCRGVAQFKHLKSIAGRHLVYDAVSVGAYRSERDGLASAHLFEHIERLEIVFRRAGLQCFVPCPVVAKPDLFKIIYGNNAIGAGHRVAIFKRRGNLQGPFRKLLRRGEFDKAALPIPCFGRPPASSWTAPPSSPSATAVTQRLSWYRSGKVAFSSPTVISDSIGVPGDCPGRTFALSRLPSSSAFSFVDRYRIETMPSPILGSVWGTNRRGSAKAPSKTMTMAQAAMIANLADGAASRRALPRVRRRSRVEASEGTLRLLPTRRTSRRNRPCNHSSLPPKHSIRLSFEVHRDLSTAARGRRPLWRQWVSVSSPCASPPHPIHGVRGKYVTSELKKADSNGIESA